MTYCRNYTFGTKIDGYCVRRRRHLHLNNQLTGCRSRKLTWGDYYMAQYYVRNLQEGSRPAPDGYSSWLDYWEKKTGQKAVFCHRVGCKNFATEGAHVQLVNGGNEWFIVPLCHPCNTSFGDRFLVEGPLVPVNQYLLVLQ